MMQAKRKLGNIETQMAVMHDVMNGTTQGSQITTLRGKIDFYALKEAAATIFWKYALLRCAIEKIDEALWFVEHDEFSRIEISAVSIANAQEWEYFYLTELGKVLNQSRALWRVTLVSGPAKDEFRIVFTCHHAIIDGSGFYVLINELLAIVEKTMLGIIDSPDQVGMPEAIDEYLLPANAELYTDSTQCGAIPYTRYASLSERRTRVAYRTTIQDQYERFEHRCKMDGINVNSALSAIIALASHAVNICMSPVSFKTAVSLRERVSTKPGYENKLGCYIAVADTAIEVAGKSVREIALNYEKKLFTYIVKNCLRRRDTDLTAIQIKVMSLDERKLFPQGIGITNLGKADLITQYKNFCIVDYEGINNRVAGNVAFVFHIVVLNATLKIKVVYPEPLIEDERIEQLCDSFMQHLASYAQGN